MLKINTDLPALTTLSSMVKYNIHDIDSTDNKKEQNFTNYYTPQVMHRWHKK